MQSKDEVNMQALIKEAEVYMYKQKRKYYEQSGHDRRRRITDAVAAIETDQDDGDT